MFGTIRDVLFDAPRTFDNMIRDGGLGGPLTYFLILSTLFGWISMLWGLVMSQGDPFQRFREMGMEIPFEYGNLMLMQAIAYPVVVLVIAMIMSGLFHLFLMLVGGANRPFETTLRVYAYTAGTTAIFYIVPFCGGFISLIWSLVVWIIGISRAHETSAGKAAAAVLLPFFICCLCVLGGVIFVIMTLGLGMNEFSGL